MIGVVIGGRIQKGGLMDTFVSCIIAHHHLLIETSSQVYKSLKGGDPETIGKLTAKIISILSNAHDYAALPNEHEYRSSYPWTRWISGSSDCDRALQALVRSLVNLRCQADPFTVDQDTDQ